MSAVDAPPGIAFGGAAVGEFWARPGPKKLARRVFVLVMIVGLLTIALASRRIYRRSAELYIVLPLFFMSVAAFGYSVRRARLRVSAGGIRWGFRTFGFTLSRDRLRSVTTYSDAIAIKPRRGSTWYLAARDWDRFERIAKALRAAGIDFEPVDRRAPLYARLQGYGFVLDTLLVLDALASVTVLLVGTVS